MSEDTPPGDKPYDPTPARLEEARKKGEIVRSSDLNTAIVYGGFLLVLALFGATLGQQIGSRLAVLLDQAPDLSRLMLSRGGQATGGGVLLAIGVPAGIILVVPGALLTLSLFAQRAILFWPGCSGRAATGFLRHHIAPAGRSPANWGGCRWSS